MRIFLHTHLDGVKIAKQIAKGCREDSYVVLAKKWDLYDVRLAHLTFAPSFLNFWIHHCMMVELAMAVNVYCMYGQELRELPQCGGLTVGGT